MLTRLILGLLPVFMFLVGLVLLDSFKLVRFRRVLFTVLIGAVAAVLAYQINSLLMPILRLDLPVYSGYVAPFVEELAKAGYIFYLFRRNKIGFLVDAAIYGFAVGAGFAFVENLYYARRLPDASLAVWIVRGFGTATMHGGTTAILAILARRFADRHQAGDLLAFAPGFLVALVLHAFYNHFFFHPITQTGLILLTLPVITVLVFQKSEARLRQWLGVGFDSDQELLELIHSGRISDTRIGRYLQALRSRFPGPVVADMLCYLRLYVELSISAKGMLLATDAGFKPRPAPDIREKFAELRYLEKSIGRAGLLAILPFLHKSRRDLWQMHLLDHGKPLRKTK